MKNSKSSKVKPKRRKQESDSPLETLRMARTTLTQDEFLYALDISRSTYQRMVSGRTPLRLSPAQIVKTCKVCNIDLRTFFLEMGIDLSGLPSGVGD